MCIFRPIIQIPADSTTALVAQFTHRRRIGQSGVDDDGFGLSTSLQRLLQEAQTGSFVPFFGEVTLEYLTLMVACAPQMRRRRMIRGIIPKPSHSSLMLATPPFG